ncbi:RHS repeat-associated core domain-containing protein [Nocardiopsis sp. HUAS JQ3]|uniref:RHS repeat-associated core domain-containing protein n=1 Tax=Nocardiopsis sp. HUAS JQ3 TaxID=3061629 RepID=UPI0023A98A7E|nr:RHS repeat-associated core domain-containing protein [Nocardiopsis sp. HUAS JQ3]WDZ93558.1 hypothetical protein PV789_13885 [Nocardiopsis sp. HUAS JQ3]
MEHSYNGRGDLLETVRTDSAGSERTTYAYDAAFRLTLITDHTGTETTFTNDANNRRTEISHPDGAVEERTYDDSGRLTGITTTGAAGQSLVEASYSYDNDGADSDQLQSRTIDGDTEEFTYDGLDRLTSNGEIDYAYDDAGNLTSAGGEDLAYNDADQVTDARGVEVDHDEAGNMTSRGGRVLEYSLTNQFLQADEDADLATSISYDTTNQTQMRGITEAHEGERIDRQLSNTALGVTNVASEGERTSFVRDANGELISMVAWDGEERFHFTTDHQNTVLAITAEGSEAESPDVVYDYTPFGERSMEASDQSGAASLNPFGFTGAYQFQDGTVHLGYRFYDTNTLNFTQPDPSRQEMNNYAYGMGDPINNVDWTGLMSLAIAAGTIGSAAAGAAAAVGMAAVCGASLGVGCLLGGVVVGAAASGFGGVVGAGLAGGSQSEIASSGRAGLVGGAVTGPLPAAPGLLISLGTSGFLVSDSA